MGDTFERKSIQVYRKGDPQIRIAELRHSGNLWHFFLSVRITLSQTAKLLHVILRSRLVARFAAGRTERQMTEPRGTKHQASKRQSTRPHGAKAENSCTITRWVHQDYQKQSAKRRGPAGNRTQVTRIKTECLNHWTTRPMETCVVL